MPKTVLLTGATGFIGNALLGRILTETDWSVVALTRPPVRGKSSVRVRWVLHDLLAPLSASLLLSLGSIDYMLHCGAEVSGLSSIADPVRSITTNVWGTQHLLEAARTLEAKRFVYLSTGEAVGAIAAPLSLPEDAPLRPSNPYAASKAAGEELVRAFSSSYGLLSVVVRSMNVFGPGQGLNRFIPMIARKMLMDEPIVCHVDEKGQSGSRNWLHVDQFTDAFMDILDSNYFNETFHVVGPERTNEQVIELVAQALGKHPRIERKVPGPSHDMRYSLKDTKLLLDFRAGFEQRVLDTARWYQ